MFALKSGRAAVFVALVITAAFSSAQEKRFTVRDSIEMATFSEPAYYSPGAEPPISPDGKYFVVVTSRGIIKSNKIETSIRLFETQAVLRFLQRDDEAVSSPAPKVLAKIVEVPVAFSGSPYNPLISDLRWASNSLLLYFLVQNANGQHYLCSVDIRTGHVATLSPRTNYDIERYSVLKGVVVYTAVRPDPIAGSSSMPPGIKINSDASIITGLSIDSILFPDSAVPPTPRFRELWMSSNENTHRIPNTSMSLLGHDMAKYLDVLSISPNGQFVIKLNPVERVPPSWQAYIPLPGYDDWRANLTNMTPANYWRPRQYVLIDLKSGHTRTLLDAPFGDSLAHLEAAEAVWSQDGQRVLLTNTFLPLDGVDSSARAQRTNLCSVADLELKTGKSRCIVFTRDTGNPTARAPKPLQLQDAAFGATPDDVVVRLGWPRDGRTLTEWYRWSNGDWKLVKSQAESTQKSEHVDHKDAKAISITIKQDLNHAPILWAQDTLTGKGKGIWNPKPQWADIQIGEASIYHWKDQTGDDFTGGLIKPVGYVPGRRYPLVIQTHGFQENEFMTDGPFPTGMAARALASADIVVLQVGSNHLHYDEASEAHYQIEGYEAAIDKLAEEGLIDPAKVGIIGFSRTCWYVESALIDAPQRFAAASISDGVDQSYMQSMIFDPNNVSDSQRIYHAKPFGEGLEEWVKLAPSFHLDKVRTPLMITAIKQASVLQEWEVYSSLYQQSRPVDFLYIPNGQHVLQKPLDRLASQQENVDWFRFWLQGYQDPDPTKADQYSRWEHLRSLQNTESKAGGQLAAPESR